MITYPLDLPTTKGVVGISLGLTFSIGQVSSPWTYATQVQDNGSAQWIVSVALTNLARVDAEKFIGFLSALKGKLGTFVLPIFYSQTPQGNVGSSTPRLFGAHSAGSEEILTAGWTNSTVGVLKVGDFLNIGAGLYKVVYADVDADANSKALINIVPSLRVNASENENILYTNPVGIFRLRSNSYQLYKVAGPKDEAFYQLDFEAEEAL